MLSDERSSNATTPVCLRPGTSTNTSVGVILTTVPVTTLLLSLSLKDSFSNSSKDASPSADALTAGSVALSAVSAVSDYLTICQVYVLQLSRSLNQIRLTISGADLLKLAGIG